MNGTLTLNVKSGSKLAAKDRGGTSDPYVKVGIIGTKGTPLHPPQTDISSPEMKTVDPQWNFQKKFQIIAGSGASGVKTILRIEVWDKNKMMSDAFMGTYEVDLPTLHLDHDELRELKDVVLVADPKHPKEAVSGTIFFTLSFFDEDLARRRLALLNRKDAGRWSIIGTSFEELTVTPKPPLLPNGDIDMKKFLLPEYSPKTTRKEYAWTGKILIEEGKYTQVHDSPVTRIQTGDGMNVSIVQDSGGGYLEGTSWIFTCVGAGIETNFHGVIAWDKNDDIFGAKGRV